MRGETFIKDSLSYTNLTQIVGYTHGDLIGMSANGVLPSKGTTCSCDMLLARLKSIESTLGKQPLSTTPKREKKARKRTAWQEHVSKCFQEPDVKSLKSFGEKIKACKKTYQKKKEDP